jgi:hypothetical protein
MDICDLIRNTPIIEYDMCKTVSVHDIVNFQVDVGEQYVSVNCNKLGAMCDFLVKGYFQYTTNRKKQTVLDQNTPGVYPIPICRRSNLRVCGVVVVTILRQKLNGCYRIGDWVVNHGTVTYSPKDYVFSMHLDVFPYTTAPGCTCCTTPLSLQHAEEDTENNYSARSHMEWVLFWGNEKNIPCSVEEYGTKKVSRLLETSQEVSFEYAAPFFNRLQLLQEALKWHKRSKFIRACVDNRSKNKRLPSFVAGTVALFL